MGPTSLRFGYSDQAHPSCEFTAAVEATPSAYAVAQPSAPLAPSGDGPADIRPAADPTALVPCPRPRCASIGHR